jgi:outer membrane receptor protein involved in Fe transport
MKHSLVYLLLVFVIKTTNAKEVDVNKDYELDAEVGWLQAEKIEVVSKQKEDKSSAAGIVSIVTREDIERYGANSLVDVLNRVTSLYMISSSIWNPAVAAMRGDVATPINTHTLILINGRPVRDGLQGGVNSFVFRDFPIHQIKQLEIVRGAGSVLYGSNAFTAVINIVTLQKQNDKLVLRGRYGSFETGQFESEVALKNEQAAFNGAIRYRNSRGALFSAIGSDGLLSQFYPNDEDVSTNFWGQWQDFTVNGFVSEFKYHDWGALFRKTDSLIDANKIFLDIGYKKQLNSHWQTQANFTYNTQHIRQNYALQGDSLNYEHSLLLENSHFFKFWDNKLNILLGGLVEMQMGKREQSGVVHIPSYTHLKSSLYGEINYALLDNLKLTLGGQWNHFEHLEKSPATTQDKKHDGLIGRTGLVYDLTPNWGIKLLYSQAFRSPSAFELEIQSALVGDRNLQPENIETTDVQVFYHSKDYETSLTAFRSRMSNLIRRQSMGLGRLQYINSGSAVFEGIELESKAKLLDNLQWTGAYTFQTNRDKYQNNISQAPNHQLKLGLSYDVTEDFSVSLFDTYFSAAKVIPAAQLVNPPAAAYHHLSLNARYELNNLLQLPHTKKITVSVFADNLLDVKAYYPEFDRKTVINTIPANPGRTVFGELAIEF